ncbi:hypothetical protein MXB_4836 [Myxobolus squamalis]|nr:hypothetical protein MXB_4836 [Myxobolus squamalis]
MIYDRGTEICVPIVYRLEACKNEVQRDACIITIDFDKPLISLYKQEFSESKIYGCYFPLTLVIRKNFINYKISSLNISIIYS